MPICSRSFKVQFLPIAGGQISVRNTTLDAPSKPSKVSELDKIWSLKNEMTQVLLFRLSLFCFYLPRLCILDSCLGNWEVVFFYCT